MVATNHRYLYAIDATDVVSYVSPGWLAFARENGAAELTAQSVLGRCLWEFIAGEETRQLYASVIQRVRKKKASLTVPFRCDSPTLRRFMRLTITRQSAGVIQLEGTINRVEPRNYLALLDRQVRRTQQQITLCSCCKRALIEPRGWLDIEEAAAYLHLFEEAAAPRVRHIICPGCAQVSNN